MVLPLFIFSEIDCFHNQSTVNICIAGPNRRAGYATAHNYIEYAENENQALYYDSVMQTLLTLVEKNVFHLHENTIKVIQLMRVVSPNFRINKSNIEFAKISPYFGQRVS